MPKTKSKIKIALAMIVKGDDEEALLLERCFENIGPYVDGKFITSTYKKGETPNKAVNNVSKLYNAEISYFEWCNDFSKARNYNFSQVPKDYDYILWCDADDQFRGLEKLKNTIEANKDIDAFGLWYLYEFDEYKQPTVVHKKTMIVRNDGCLEWVGALHEDFKENRSVKTKFIEGIERMHFTNEKRIEISRNRNVEVSLEDSKQNPEDPRVWWNLGNSYLGSAQSEKAKDVFYKFIDMSNSEEEKYLAYCRLSEIENMLSNRDKAIQNLQIAIGMRPDYSDAYLQLGYLYFSYRDFDKAESYLLQGLIKKPPYHSIIVYNPRDYDYNPMMLLAKTYFEKNRPDLALPMLEGCLKIYPENETIKIYVEDMKKERDRLEKVLLKAKELEDVTDKELLRKELDSLDDDLKSHPAINIIRNRNFIRETSSGKDIAYYCGMTDHEWNPELFKTKGFGGSEEAVINLSKEWAKKGYNVTVYNNCGPQEITADGVNYKPFWTFNSRDKWDYLIIWRHPKLLDYELNADHIYVDMHDVIQDGEFNQKRLDKIEKVFIKTQFHRSLFPSIPDTKIEIIPNGIDFNLFKVLEEQELANKKDGKERSVWKDQYLIVNTSSPDRSMDVMPKLFRMIKEKVPQAQMKWAYGWNTFDETYRGDSKMMEWRTNLQKEIEEAGIECLGKIPQSECAKLYLEGNILAYPSEFAEIDCISVKKAQACGCVPVTTDFGAFNESVQYGVKIHSDKTKDTWCPPFTHSFGIKDEKQQQEWVDAVVEQLQKPIDDRVDMKNWAKQFSWDLIADKWVKVYEHRG